MKRKLSLWTLMSSVALLGFLPLSAHAGKAKEFPACSFQPTIAIDDFTTENLFVGNHEFAGNARDVVVNTLVNSGCYKVVERGRSGLVSGGYDREQAIKQSGAARKGQKSARSGQVTSASHLVQCALTSVSAGNTGGGISGIGGGWGGLGGGGLSTKSTKIGITCRIYNSSTSEIVASSAKEKSKVDVGVDAFGAGTGVGIGANFFYETPLGKTMAALIKDTLIDVTEKVQKNPWS